MSKGFVVPEVSDDPSLKQSSTSFATSRIITVLVGPDRQAYRIHKDLLLKYCPFFEKCLKEPFREGQEDQVVFPDDSPVVFDCFVDWIYGAKVSECEDRDDVALAVQTFVLADKLCMSNFQNALIDSIRAYRRDYNLAPRPLTLAYISRNGPPHSKLKALLLDQMVYDIMSSARTYQGEQWRADREELEEVMSSGGELPSEIIWAMRSFHIQPFSDPVKRARCHYHTHETDEDRKRCEEHGKSESEW